MEESVFSKNTNIEEGIAMHPIVPIFGDGWLLIRYGVSGVVGIMANLIAVYVLTEILHLWHIISAILAFSVNYTVTFLLQKFWTFGGRGGRSAAHQAFLYLVIALGALVLNIAVLYVFSDIFGFWYLGVQGIALFFLAGGSFLLNKYLTFS